MTLKIDKITNDVRAENRTLVEIERAVRKSVFFYLRREEKFTIDNYLIWLLDLYLHLYSPETYDGRFFGFAQDKLQELNRKSHGTKNIDIPQGLAEFEKENHDIIEENKKNNPKDWI